MDAEGDAYENNRCYNKKIVNIPLSSPTTAIGDGGGDLHAELTIPSASQKPEP